MALIPMDFSGEIKPLEAGTYNARVRAAVVKTSAAGNPYVDWQLETFGSPEVNGKTIFYSTPLSGGWVTKLAELHKAATGEEIDKKSKQYDPEMLIGKELVATVVAESYTAKDGTAKTKLAVKALARKG